MSYDLYLFRPKAGVDPLETAEQLFSEGSEEINPGLPQPEKEKQKRDLADALIKLNPELEVFPFDFQAIAKLQSITEDEARLRFRHLELNGAEDGNGIQITLEDDSASIAVPYWHVGEKARDAFKEIWSYLSLLKKEAGFVAYDPQVEKILDLTSDMPEVVAVYESVSKTM